MNSEEWNRVRSNFNHGWLKNRFIVALHRASRVLSGAVEDHSGLESLRSLLAEWPERSREVWLLLQQYGSSSTTDTRIIASDAEQYVRAVAQSSWEATENPSVKQARAEAALREMDVTVEHTRELSTSAIDTLRGNAQRLATTLSVLSVFVDPNESCSPAS